MLIDDDVKSLAAGFIFESNLIEGIRVPLGQIIAQIRSGGVSGHVGALLFFDKLAVSRKIIGNEEICSAQKLVIKEQNDLGAERLINETGIGCYRGLGVNVVIAGRMGMRPERIEKSMSILLRNIEMFLNGEKMETAPCSQGSRAHMKYVVKQIARFHYRFEQIHPFVDGNGRTGRLLVWYLFRFLGITPFIFTDYDKRYTYYRCFDDVKDMEKYFLRRYIL